MSITCTTNLPQIQTIIRPRSPLFTNLMEQDSGIVTAGMINARVNQNVSDEDAKTDLYRPAKSFAAVKELLERGVEEYNKIHPRIKMALYKVRQANLKIQISGNKSF